jgi:hypothetical protein
VSNAHVFSSQAVPVIFGAIVIVAMAVAPGGAAELIARMSSLSIGIRKRHDSSTPHSLEAR